MKLFAGAFLHLAAGATVLPGVSRTARAQTYPSRPITMVVPFAAGGAFDVLGRIVAAQMSEILGQQVIIENTTGAAGIIGVKRVASAAPDGYTFLFGSIGTHAYNQTIYRKPRYDAVERLYSGCPVCRTAYGACGTQRFPRHDARGIHRLREGECR